MLTDNTYIAGVKFRDGAADYLAELDRDATFTLEPEPTNKYDPNAVKVMHGEKHLGYVPKDLAPLVCRRIAAGLIDRVTRRGETNSGIDIHYREEAA